MNPVIYAVGDVHGRDDLLGTLHGYIVDYHSIIFPDRSAILVHLGDYIDGGPESLAVIDRLIKGVPGFANVCLLGNHEALLLECLDTDDRQVWNNWLNNGGTSTLASLGLSFPLGGYHPLPLIEALGKERIAWLRSLPNMYQTNTHLFVHAGIAPGVPIQDQDPKDLIWIRSRFLNSNADHGAIVVHGHTPADDPVVRPNRICVDTGATSNGVLTAAVLDGCNAPVFLRSTARPSNAR